MAGELKAIIDSAFCVTKEGLPLHHPSLEEKPEVFEVRIRILTTWFDAGTLEYVCRWHRLSQCIIACG